MKEVIVRLKKDHVKFIGSEYVQDLVRCKDCYKHGTNMCSLWDGMVTEDYMWCYYGERDE